MFTEIGLEPSETSYFSTPESGLDMRLFTGHQLRPAVRNGIKRILFEYLVKRFNQPERWTKVWLAGSGISYQWSATRDPGDLDCLVGIEYPIFRQYNNEYAGLSNIEIAQMFNEDFNLDIMPNTKNWNDPSSLIDVNYNGIYFTQNNSDYGYHQWRLDRNGTLYGPGDSTYLKPNYLGFVSGSVKAVKA